MNHSIILEADTKPGSLPDRFPQKKPLKKLITAYSQRNIHTRLLLIFQYNNNYLFFSVLLVYYSIVLISSDWL